MILCKRQQQYVKLEEIRKKRGKMIEVYSVLDRLIEYIREKANEKKKATFSAASKTLIILSLLDICLSWWPMK